MVASEIAKAISADVRSILTQASRGAQVYVNGSRVIVEKLGGETLTLVCDEAPDFYMRKVGRNNDAGLLLGPYEKEGLAVEVLHWIK